MLLIYKASKVSHSEGKVLLHAKAAGDTSKRRFDKLAVEGEKKTCWKFSSVLNVDVVSAEQLSPTTQAQLSRSSLSKLFAFALDFLAISSRDFSAPNGWKMICTKGLRSSPFIIRILVFPPSARAAKAKTFPNKVFPRTHKMKLFIYKSSHFSHFFSLSIKTLTIRARKMIRKTFSS